MAKFLKSQRRIMSVHSVDQLTGDVVRVVLCSLDAEPLVFYAGQYLMLHYSDDAEACAYSIASSPVPPTKYIELHIECRSISKVAMEVVQYLRQHVSVEVALPAGHCFLRSENIPETPLIFIAAATGFSQMKSMIEFIKTTQHAHPKWLYWGVMHQNGFYMPDLPKQWEKEGLIYHQIVSDKNSEWKGRFGLLYEAVLEDRIPLFHKAHFYIGGSYNMVQKTVDQLVKAGLSKQAMHSDALS